MTGRTGAVAVLVGVAALLSLGRWAPATHRPSDEDAGQSWTMRLTPDGENEPRPGPFTERSNLRRGVHRERDFGVGIQY